MNGIKKEEIYDKDILLTIVLRDGDYLSGTNFYSNPQDYIQAGTWNHPKGHKIQAHSHCAFDRVVGKTQEAVFLKKGKMKSNIYDLQEKKLAEITLNPGDIAIYLNGGHDFEMLEDNTQVFELKNGPYLGKKEDKKMIN